MIREEKQNMHVDQERQNVENQQKIILFAANECGKCKHYKSGVCTWYNIDMSPSHDARDCDHYAIW